jgi:hypothetical protein
LTLVKQRHSGHSWFPTVDKSKDWPETSIFVIEDDARNELVGLLFAGSQQHMLVNPINDVLAELATALSVPALSEVTV